MRYTTAGREAGFSLVELMVVLVMLTLALLPLAFVQTRAREEVNDSGRYTEAIALGQLQLESAKSLGFGNIQAANGVVDNMNWTLTVQNVGVRLEQVNVRVNWIERGDPREMSFVTLVSDR
jgi:prepilin-type N-terminal cleavage/methylation domain-containing protein